MTLCGELFRDNLQAAPEVAGDSGAQANIDVATHGHDEDCSRLLQIGAIWELLRSGSWYAGGQEIMREEDVWIQETTAFIVRKLSELQRDLGTAGQQGDLLAGSGWKNQSYSIVELERVLRALRSLSSPWRKLPPELLIEVFWWCIPDPATTSITSLQAPLLLSQVCWRWYDLGTNLPSLWASVTLFPNFLMREESHMHATTNFEDKLYSTRVDGLRNGITNLMDTFITRSLNFPILLSIHSGVLLQPNARKLFYDHVSRCKTLALYFPPRRFLRMPPPSLTLDPFKTPLLEALNVYSHNILNDSWNASCSSVLTQVITTSAGNLRRLNLNVVDPNIWYQVDFTQSWENLTHITWRPVISHLALISLFHSASNLVYASFPHVLNIHHITPNVLLAPDGNLQSPVVLENLQTLVVGLRDMSSVFNAVTLPALRHLVHLSPGNTDKNAMVAFFKRSRCPLETLYLYSASYSQDTDLLEVLESVEADQQLPEMFGEKGRNTKGCLKALLISGPPGNHQLLSDKFMEHLTWAPERLGHNVVNLGGNSITGKDWGVLFPGLVYLSFYDSGTMDPDKLLTLLRSRTLHQEQEQNLTSSFAPIGGHSTTDYPSPPVARLMVYETWHQDSEMNTVSDDDWEGMYPLREFGLLFRMFKEAHSRSHMTDAEKLLLRRYVKEGLVLWDYVHDTGQFGPIPFEQETRMD